MRWRNGDGAANGRHRDGKTGAANRRAFGPIPTAGPWVRAIVGCLLVASSLLWAPHAASAQHAPAGLDQEVAAGPWEMRLVEVQTGDDAAGAVAGASSFNPSSAGDGLQFVVARLSVANTSSAAHVVQPDDFAVVGSDGIVRRPGTLVPPSPALTGRVGPGESLEGWVVGVAPADGDAIVLRYDSASLTGTWADADFAVTEGATLPVTDGRAERTNTDGRNGEAVGVDVVVSTREWAVSLQEVVIGPAVYDIAPPGTQRLADSYRAGSSAICMETWVALRFRIANNGDDGRARFLSQTAFQLVDEDFEPIPDQRFLSAPAPEATGEYLPGAERSGWVAFEIPSLCDGDAVNLLTDSTVVRFLPFADSRDARYFDFSGGGALPADETRAVAELAEGDQATVAADEINLRAEPSTESEIVAELERGEVVTVTGAAEEAEGITWYPVSVDASGETGFVAGDLLEASS